MFLGHFALALAAKRAAPRTSLATTVAAAQLVDLLWPFFLIAGIETLNIRPGVTAFNPLEFTHYPFTHSLLTGVLWAAAFGGGYYAFTKYKRGAVVVALLVVSHWFLDWVTHIPDLPLYPGGGPKVGLGLWNSVTATVAVEGILFLAGVVIYARMTRARDTSGRFLFGAFVGALGGFYVLSIRGPVPPNWETVAYSAIALWLFVPWAGWFDRHRDVVTGPEDPPNPA